MITLSSAPHMLAVDSRHREVRYDYAPNYADAGGDCVLRRLLRVGSLELVECSHGRVADVLSPARCRTVAVSFGFTH